MAFITVNGKSEIRIHMDSENITVKEYQVKVRVKVKQSYWAVKVKQ